jgi:hypothetical protein
MGGDLIGSADAGIEDNHNAELRNADATRQPVPLGSIYPYVTAMAMSHVDSVGHTPTEHDEGVGVSALEGA